MLVGQRHRLDLVMGDIDGAGRGAEVAVLQTWRSRSACLHPQRRVEIGERLVEQERRRLAHDGAADGDALALAAGKLALGLRSR